MFLLYNFEDKKQKEKKKIQMNYLANKERKNI